ncbi:MAG: T9SS type A sorting domain-containing protein [Flavobacteriales bacterium]
MKKLSMAILLGIVFPCLTLAQNLTMYSELTDKYWQYRDRFKKHFIKIGLDQGESIPASAWRVNWAHAADHTNSALYWTDATIYLGHYLQVLATEYKLLSSRGLSTEKTENEIYFAVRALNRLDQQAEPFLYGTDENINGLLLRDDVPANFHEHFKNAYSPVFNTTSELEYTHSDYAPLHVYSDQGELGTNQSYNPNNVQSLDQLVDIFTGAYLLYKLVPNIGLQPPGQEVIQLHPYITNIIGRIYARLENQGYVIHEFDNQDPVSRGAYCWYGAPMFKHIAREMLGGYEGYADFIQGMYQISQEEAEDMAWDHGVDVLYPMNNPTISHDTFQAQWEMLENTNLPMSNNGFCIDTEIFGGLFSSITDFVMNEILDNWNVNYNSSNMELCLLPGTMNEDNLHIMFQLALLNQTWSPAYLGSNATLPENGFYWYPLLYEVMHGVGQDQNYNNENFYLEMLSYAPCEGPWSDPNYEYFGQETAQAPDGWASQNRLFHPDNAYTGPEDPSFRGEYSGIDYMLYHNLVQLVYGTEQTFGLEKTCACASQLVDDEIVDYNVTSEPAFDDYSSKGISIPDYLSHNTTFENCSVQLMNDLVICRPYEGATTEIIFQSGAQLNIAEGVKVVVKNGCTLTLDNSLLTFNGMTFNEDLNSLIHVEEGALLQVINGTVVDVATPHTSGFFIQGDMHLINSALSLSDESARTQLFASEGGTVNIYSSNYSQSYLGKLDVIAADDGSILMDNLNWNLRGGYWSGRNSGAIDVMNSTMNYEDVELDFDSNTYISFETSAIEFDQSMAEFNDGALLETIESTFKLSGNTHFLFNIHDDNPSRWTYDHSALWLNGNNSKVALNGGILHVTQGSIFKPLFDDVSGFIEIGNQLDHEVELEPGSQMWLEGAGQDDLILKVVNNGNLWIEQSQAVLTIRNGFVNMGNNGHVWTASAFNANNVKFSDEYTEDSSADVAVWFKPANISNCLFTGSGYKGVQNNSMLQTSTFVKGSGAQQNGGRYLATSCTFISTGIQSHLLTNVSRVVNSQFTNPHALSVDAIVDASQSELIVETSSIDGFTHGISKQYGKSTNRCNQISNCNVAVKNEFGIVNLSSLDNAGFNSFEDNGYNINLNSTVQLDLEKGRNHFGIPVYKNVDGTIALSCGKVCDDQNILARGNDWFGNVNDMVSITTSNADCGGSCNFFLFDESPVTYDGCPASRPFPKPRSVNSHVDLISNNRDLSSELVYLSNYGSLPLDSALGIAATRMETYDSLANDIEAVEMFHEILMQNLMLDSLDVRRAAQWGVENMKTALENLFASHEISVAENRDVFHPLVQHYVDVLNEMTTESTADSLVTTQFYLELNKGHLFRTIYKHEMAKEIFVHLDDCALDSLEQSIVNYWLSEIENEIEFLSTVQSDLELMEIESTTASLDNTDFADLDDYRFGVYIHDPNYVSFVNCSQLVFNRGIENGSSDLFAYPNPNRGDFYLKTPIEGAFDLEVYDMLGTLVFKRHESAGGVVRLQLPSELSTGNYLVKVIQQDESKVVSVMIENH